MLPVPRIAGLGGILLVATLLVLNSIGAYRRCDDLRPVHSGEPAPNVSLNVIDEKGRITGTQVQLSELQGSVVVVDFWATWCGPCKNSLPVLEDIAGRYGPKGVVVLSINTEGKSAPQEARSMIDRLAPSVRLVVDFGEASRLYSVNTIPHMVIVDREGVVRWVHRGFSSSSRLRKDLERALDGLL